MNDGFLQRRQIELPTRSAQHLAQGYLPCTVHHRADDHEDIVHHGREEHHRGHHREDDAGGANGSILHPLPCHAHQFDADIGIADLLQVVPRKDALQQFFYLFSHLIHIGIGPQAHIRMVAVVAYQVFSAVPCVGTHGWHRHQDVETAVGGVFGIVVEHAADGHRLLRGRGEAERLSHHIATNLLTQASADHALSGSGENLPGIAHQHRRGEDVEEARVGKHRLAEVVAAAVLERQLLLAELRRVARGTLYLRYFSSQHRRNTSRRCTMLLPGFALALESLLQFKDTFLVHDAAVVVHLQLHLGYQHQPYGQADGQRDDLDESSLFSIITLHTFYHFFFCKVKAIKQIRQAFFPWRMLIV